MLVGTIDFYDIIPLSLTLTLPGGDKVSAKEKLSASFFCNDSSVHGEILYVVEAIQVEHSVAIFE